MPWSRGATKSPSCRRSRSRSLSIGFRECAAASARPGHAPICRPALRARRSGRGCRQRLQHSRELGRVAPRDTVPDRERHDRGLQPRPERRARNTGRELSARPGRTLGAAHSVKPMLSDLERDRRQLGDLVTPRLHDVDQLLRAEHVRARPAALGPMLDHLVDLLGRKQPPVLALMPGLAAPPPTRPLRARTRRRRRSVLRGRQRRVPRTPVQPPLKLRNPCLESLVRLDPRTRFPSLPPDLSRWRSRAPTNRSRPRSKPRFASRAG